jgi:aspartyl-tRNA(Asn)/glutamyl-tRNA(Gln) amidotransferase subunit C
MKIDRKVVEYVAHLARLHFEEDEIDVYTEQLDRILAYMDKLNTLDTDGIEPTSHVIPLTNVFRDDVVNFNFSIEESVGNAPEKKGSAFRVPPVIEVD